MGASRLTKCLRYTSTNMNSLAAVCLLVTLTRASGLTSVPGIPGQDYPTLDFYNLPATSFECRNRINGGFYSDEEAFCQMYHMCVAEATGTFKKFSFSAPTELFSTRRSLFVMPGSMLTVLPTPLIMMPQLLIFLMLREHSLPLD